jgi:hypothetical protein
LLQVELVGQVLKMAGEVMTVPIRSTDEINDGKMFLFTHLQDKICMRDELDSGNSSSMVLKLSWPDPGMDGHLSTGVQIDISYRLPLGMPPSFWPSVLRECTSLGLVVAVYKWGALLKSGAAEILVSHEIHGCENRYKSISVHTFYICLLHAASVSSSIDVHGRVTKWNEDANASL